ncbi:hypothetical protein C8J56DRAFT_975983 [Mycena floridula]|nr:hypothetical protein C8J56DRAFT_975983 [Mycena floridula]
MRSVKLLPSLLSLSITRLLTSSSSLLRNSVSSSIVQAIVDIVRVGFKEDVLAGDKHGEYGSLGAEKPVSACRRLNEKILF